MNEADIWECRCGHRNADWDIECGNCHVDRTDGDVDGES